MKNKKHLMAGALCLFLTPVLFAQRKISLQDVWQQTIQQHPSLTSRQALVEKQEINKTITRQKYLPDMSAQFQQTYGSYQSIPGSFFPIPGLYTPGIVNKNNGSTMSGANMNASAIMQWDFLQFGKMKKDVAVADAGISVSKAALSEQIFKLRAAGTRYYFGALHSTALIHLFNADAIRLSVLYDLIKAQSAAGLRPGADSLLIKSAYLQASSKINEENAALQTSLLQLGELMGVENETLIIDTAGYFIYDENLSFSNHTTQQHPYLQYLDAGIQYSRAALQSIKKEVFPSVGLLAGAGARGSGIEPTGTINKSITAPWNNPAGNYLVGIGISWRLSSLYTNKNKQRSADLDISAANADYKAAKNHFDALYAAALVRWKEKIKKLRASRLAFEASRQAYEQYTVRYENGLINLIELLQLQKNLQDAEVYYASAVQSCWNELIDQSEALGDPSLLLTAIQPSR